MNLNMSSVGILTNCDTVYLRLFRFNDEGQKKTRNSSSRHISSKDAEPILSKQQNRKLPSDDNGCLGYLITIKDIESVIEFPNAKTNTDVV